MASQPVDSSLEADAVGVGRKLPNIKVAISKMVKYLVNKIPLFSIMLWLQRIVYYTMIMVINPGADKTLDMHYLCGGTGQKGRRITPAVL
jgi:hypothetical protein